MEYIRKVVDDYQIKEESSKRKFGAKDIIIIYKTNGEEYIKSTFYDVPFAIVEKVKEKLTDCTLYNSKAKELCQTISITTIMYQVDDIINGRI